MSIPLPITSSDNKLTLDGSGYDDPAEAEADSSPTQNESHASRVQQTSTDNPPDQVKLTHDQGHQNRMTDTPK